MNSFLESIILLPTLNEKKNLEMLVPGIFEFMPGISVLIIDDSSKDGTVDLVKDLQKKFPNLFILERKTRFGYGTAVLDGFRWALERSYKFIITMDADFSHDFHSIPGFLNQLETSDVVIGSRYIPGGGIENWKLPRRLLSKFANFYVRLVLGIPIHDVTTGFNGYKCNFLRKIDLSSIRSNGYAFLVELKLGLFRLGAKIEEIPIKYTERREGESKMAAGVIWESIWLPWKLRGTGLKYHQIEKLKNE